MSFQAAVDSLMQTRSDVNKSLDGIADSVFEIAAENSIDLTSKHPVSTKFFSSQKSLCHKIYLRKTI